MEKGKICLSFDDARLDNYTIVYPILKKYGLRATLNVTTGYVMGEPEAQGAAEGFAPMTTEQLLELHRSGVFEIAAHGHFHHNNQADIAKGVKTLAQWMGDEWFSEGIGFASPRNHMGEERYIAEKAFFESQNVVYVRGHRRLYDFSSRLRNLLLGVFVVNENWYSWHTGLTCMQDPTKRSFFRSLRTTFNTPLKLWKRFVDTAAQKGKTCVFMIHSVLRPGDENYGTRYTYDAEKFEELCKYLREMVDAGKIEVLTNMEIYKAGK